MHLNDKGAIKPAPVLDDCAEMVSQAIQSWPNVISATHWLLGSPGVVDGADFYVGEAELGHIHLDGSIHLALTKPLRDLLVGRGLAGPFRWSAAWVVAPIRSVAEADSAMWLFRLAYDRLRGASDQEIRDRILSHGSEEVGVKTGPRLLKSLMLAERALKPYADTENYCAKPAKQLPETVQSHTS